MASSLKPGFEMPTALSRLFDWIEDHHGVEHSSEGVMYGRLAPSNVLAQFDSRYDETGEEVGEQRGGGTDILFAPNLGEGLHHWFGVADDHPALARLSVIAQTGGDGSMAALWLDDASAPKIVHLGSGSGSVMACVLATDPVDFLRLLAIGYDEICWDDVFDDAPNANWQGSGVYVEPNAPFQNWVMETFGVDIPRTGRDIVGPTTSIGDRPPTGDPFCDWLGLCQE